MLEHGWSCGRRFVHLFTQKRCPSFVTPSKYLLPPQSYPIASSRDSLQARSLTKLHRRPLRLGSKLVAKSPLVRGFCTGGHRLRWVQTVGGEPGIGTENTESDSLDTRSRPNCESEIKVVDYSNESIVEHDLTNESLAPFLRDNPKPEWAACRWIHVNGLDWSVVKCLGDHKNLHRLAIEDVLDTNTPAKVDWYDGHCFMEMPLQKLVPLRMADRHGRRQHTTTDFAEDLQNQADVRPHRLTWHTFSHGKFGMSVEQVSFFLTADNTVITIFEQSGNDVLMPILRRLNSSHTVVRASNDPSILVQAVIDTVVDLSLPIGKAVAEEFAKLELEVLTRPEIKQSKQVYILRSGLTHLYENTNAIASLVRTLCDHRALASPGHSPSESKTTNQLRKPMNNVFISPEAQVYLQDVQDHITTLSRSVNMSIRSAENLTALIFNTIAASQNESVRQLTLVSSFFLPLTFLTGYFGMNFDPMPVVSENSDAFFWVLAGPVMLVTSLFLLLRSQRLRSIRLLRYWRGSEVKNSATSGTKP